MMTTRLAFRFFLKVFAKDIAKAAYVGVLGRQPDAEGLQAYSKMLSNTGGLALLLADLAESREAWEYAVGQHAEDMARLVFRGLWNREPDPDSLAEWTEQFSRDKDLASLVHAISVATGYSSAATAVVDPRTLINAAFQGLLGRDPDPEGLASYTKLLRETEDVALLLDNVGSSAEHREWLARREPQLQS